jgi:hypothetical protein
MALFAIVQLATSFQLSSQWTTSTSDNVKKTSWKFPGSPSFRGKRGAGAAVPDGARGVLAKNPFSKSPGRILLAKSIFMLAV